MMELIANSNNLLFHPLRLCVLALKKMLPEDFLLKRIVIAVVSMHLIFLLLVTIDASLMIRDKPKDRLIVKTVTLGQPRPKPKPIPKQIETISEITQMEVVEEAVVKPEPAVKQKPAAKQKETEKKPSQKTTETKKTAKTKPKESSKKEKAPDKKTAQTSKKKETKTATAAPLKQEKANPALKTKQIELLQKAKESIAKVDKNYSISGAAAASSTHLLKPIANLEIDALSIDSQADLNDREIGYVDELVGRLKLMLRLPEYGEVKVKLTLQRSGKVAKLAISSSKSEANRKYIEKTLPTLSFPSFGSNFGNDDQYTFTLALSND